MLYYKANILVIFLVNLVPGNFLGGILGNIDTVRHWCGSVYRSSGKRAVQMDSA